MLKIDVEGHERKVLEGATRFFEEGRIKAVYVDGSKTPNLPDWLSAKGLRLLDGQSLASFSGGRSLLAVKNCFFVGDEEAPATEALRCKERLGQGPPTASSSDLGALV